MAYIQRTGTTGLVGRHLPRDLIACSLKGPASRVEAGTYHHEGMRFTFLAGYLQNAHQDRPGRSP
jgi:hypothetical protein